MAKGLAFRQASRVPKLLVTDVGSRWDEPNTRAHVTARNPLTALPPTRILRAYPTTIIRYIVQVILLVLNHIATVTPSRVSLALAILSA